MKLALFGGVATRAYAEKMIKDGEAALKISAAEKPNVVIAWAGTELDGRSGVQEGVNEQGKVLVRLDMTGGVFAVPADRIMAAPATKEKKEEKPKDEKPKDEKPKDPSGGEKGAEARKPDPGSRGKAPQPEEIKPKAKENVTEIIEPPSELERVKPKALPIEEARTAPEASTPIQALVSQIESIEQEKVSAEEKIASFAQSINLDLIDEHYKKEVQKLHDLIKETGQPVLKLKDSFLAVDVKRDLVEANMSEETKKKLKEFQTSLAKKKKEMTDLNKKIADLEKASFARMGGTEKQEQRVTMFESTLIAMLAKLKPAMVATLTAAQVSKLQRLEAGLKEMFSAVFEKAKEFMSGFQELFKEGTDFLRSYEKDAKAVEKEAPAEATPAAA